jgi:hypothetical protein
MSETNKEEVITIKDLENLNLNDKAAYLIKSIGGALPYFGSWIAETLVTIIPNQRQDRIIIFLKELDKRLNDLPDELINELNGNPKFIALLEESVEQSARINTQERIEYLASIVIYGISDEKIELEESEYILSLFKLLTDVQVIWLKYYSLYLPAFQKPYYKTHENILKRKMAFLGASSDDLKQEALQQSNSDHLVRLGLVEEEFDYDSSTKQLVIDSSKKKPKVRNKTITTLGKTVLSHIGIYEDPRELLKKQE